MGAGRREQIVGPGVRVGIGALAGNPDSAPYGCAWGLALWVPTFSSVGMEMTWPGRALRVKGTPFCDRVPLGPVSSLKEMVPVTRFTVSPWLHQSVLGGRLGLQLPMGKAAAPHPRAPVWPVPQTPCSSASGSRHLLPEQAPGKAVVPTRRRTVSTFP